jgi:hypothetical protein
VLGNAPLSFESLLAIRTAKSRGHVGNEMKDILELFSPKQCQIVNKRLPPIQEAKWHPIGVGEGKFGY